MTLAARLAGSAIAILLATSSTFVVAEFAGMDAALAASPQQKSQARQSLDRVMISRRRADRRLALELLDSVGLADRSDHRAAQLSGGEQQRVAIARALANDPLLILADEPTGNLDDDNSRNVMLLLCRSCRERGKTLIVAAHDSYTMDSPDITFEMRSGVLTAHAPESEAHTARGQGT